MNFTNTAHMQFTYLTSSTNNWYPRIQPNSWIDAYPRTQTDPPTHDLSDRENSRRHHTSHQFLP